MPLYNVYADEGGRMSRVYSFTASDESAARTFVRERLTETPVELWCHSKRVARFEKKAPTDSSR